MKLIVAVIHKDDAVEVTGRLSKAGFMSTRLSTTGGFLRAGNVTLLIGTEDKKVDAVLEVLRSCCSRRTEIISATAGNYDQFFPAQPVEVTVGGATVFVLDVDRFIKL